MNDAHECGVNEYKWISSHRLDEKWKGDGKFWGMAISKMNHMLCAP